MGYSTRQFSSLPVDGQNNTEVFHSQLTDVKVQRDYLMCAVHRRWEIWDLNANQSDFQVCPLLHNFTPFLICLSSSLPTTHSSYHHHFLARHPEGLCSEDCMATHPCSKEQVCSALSRRQRAGTKKMKFNSDKHKVPHFHSNQKLHEETVEKFGSD